MIHLTGTRRRLLTLATGTASAASLVLVGPLAVPASTAAPQPVATVDSSSRAAFISSVVPLAQQGQVKYGVPASVTIAQAILESGSGTSLLSQRGQAYFGIKCRTHNGPYATGCLDMRTREVVNDQEVMLVDGFRTYRSPRESFLDHGHFLTTNSRYAPAFQFKKDPDRFIAEVHKAGYATDPAYTEVVVRLMKTHNLYQYDKLPAKKRRS